MKNNTENRILWWLLAVFISNITIVGSCCFWVGSTVTRIETTMHFMVKTDEGFANQLANIEIWKNSLYEKQIKIQ